MPSAKTRRTLLMLDRLAGTGPDFHVTRLHAACMFGIEPTRVTAEQRQVVKRVLAWMTYGGVGVGVGGNTTKRAELDAWLLGHRFFR